MGEDQEMLRHVLTSDLQDYFIKIAGSTYTAILKRLGFLNAFHRGSLVSLTK